MKLSEKQAHLLLQVLLDTLRWKDDEQAFSFDHKTRVALYDGIVNQQSSALKELE